MATLVAAKYAEDNPEVVKEGVKSATTISIAILIFIIVIIIIIIIALAYLFRKRKPPSYYKYF